MNQNSLFFIQIQTLLPSMHHKWKEIILFKLLKITNILTIVDEVKDEIN